MSVTEEAAVITLAVICDDIRLEHDGRHSLMGVLGGKVSLKTEDPEAGDPKFFHAMYFETVSRRDCELSFRLWNSDTEEVIFDFDGALEHDGEDGVAEAGHIAIPPREFSLSASGVYQLQYKVDGGDWITCKEFAVNINRPVGTQL